MRSASFVLQDHRVVLDRLRACSAAPSAWSCRVFRSSIDCSAETSWVAKVCAVCSYSRGLGLVARGAGLVGQHERLPGRALQLLDLGHLPGQLHLELALVADHRRGLLDQRLVLALRLLDRLLDLDLRVGVLVDLGAEAAPSGTSSP